MQIYTLDQIKKDFKKAKVAKYKKRRKKPFLASFPCEANDVKLTGRY